MSTMNVIIVGTGDMAHGLAQQWVRTNNHYINQNDDDYHGHSLRIASPRREYVPGTTFHNTGVGFIDLVKGLQEANAVILAIPGKAMASFVETHSVLLQDCLIVNLNNDKNSYEWEMLDQHNLQWVQGLNDIGAIDLLSRSSIKKSKPKTRMSGKDPHSVDEAKKMAEECFGFDVTIIDHGHRKKNEQESIGKEWKHAAYVAVGLWVAFGIVVTIQHYKLWPEEEEEWDDHKWPVTVQNKINAATAMGLFSLSVIPGTIARAIKAWSDDSLYVLPANLLWALSIRKHLGLIGLFFMSTHVVFSMLNFGPRQYHKTHFDGHDATDMGLTGQVSMMFATYSTIFYAIIGISSLPSVQESMNKAQFAFVFGPFAWIALAFGHAHYCVTYFRHLQGTRDEYGGIPHIILLASLLPWTAFLLKFLQLSLCHGQALARYCGCRPRRRSPPTTTHMSGFSTHSTELHMLHNRTEEIVFEEAQSSDDDATPPSSGRGDSVETC